DLHLVLRGGLLGRQRIARHLWRMTFPWLIAANTLFQGQARLFPVGLRRTYALYVPIVLVIGATAFCLVRVLFSRGDRRPPGGGPPSPGYEPVAGRPRRRPPHRRRRGPRAVADARPPPRRPAQGIASKRCFAGSVPTIGEPSGSANGHLLPPKKAGLEVK